MPVGGESREEVEQCQQEVSPGEEAEQHQWEVSPGRRQNSASGR